MKRGVIWGVILATGLSVTSAYAEERYGFVLKWGGMGTESGKFNEPTDIAIDSENNIYVVELRNKRIQKFTAQGEFIIKWGKYGNSNGEFEYPMGIAVDSNDNIYVADTCNHRIQKFTKEGKFITKWGSYGTKTGEFDHPTDIAVDSKNNIYVVEWFNHRIQKFTSSGEFIAKWGSCGTQAGQFLFPFGRTIDITIDSNDNIYVSDTGNHRVQKFTISGEFITKGDSYGGENGQFKYPSGIAVDTKDNVYVIDIENYHIQKFTSSGEFITKWGSEGIENGQFKGPVDIEIDKCGNVYIVDVGTSYIQKFIPLPSFEETSSSIPVYPNPYREDFPHKYIVFGKSEEPLKRLPEYGTIKIYTIVGELVKSLTITPADGGTKKWYVDNESCEKVASGIYIYCITDSERGWKYKGKIGIIR